MIRYGKTALKMRLLVLCFISLIFPVFSFSQGEFNNWYFGDHAGSTFNYGTPVALTNCSTAFWETGTSITVSDSLGHLLFYSDGVKVYNRHHFVMPNGYGLNPYPDLGTQIIFYVPYLHDSNFYYVFTVGIPWDSAHRNPEGLRYSVIDMRLDTALGDIPSGQKNILIPSAWDAGMNVTGTRHRNNKFAWIVSRKYHYSSYYASYLINDTGLDTTAVLSNSLLPINPNTPHEHLMREIKISPDGNQLIAAYNYFDPKKPTSSVLEVCNFNSQTGQITPLFLIAGSFLPNGGMASMEFSLDSKYLYASEYNILTGHSQIVQFDATKQDSLSFVQSRDTIAPNLGNWSSGLQLGPDRKIYCSVNAMPYLNLINNPSVQGSGCNFQINAVDLLGHDGFSGLPQLLQRYYVYLSHNGQCSGDSINFSTTLFPPVDSLHWDFGDPSSGNRNFSNLSTPFHIYSSAGSYNVALIVRHNDRRMDTAWQLVTVLPGPQPDLGPDQTICTGDSVTFDAGACSGCTYLWKNLGLGTTVGTNQTFKTGLTGTYTAIVTGSNGCIGRDTVQLITTAIPVLANNPLNKTICTGELTNISLSSAPPGAAFHWTATLTLGNVTGFSADSGLVINQVLVNSLSTPGIVTYHITPKIGSCSGSALHFPVTVNPGDSVKVSISTSLNNICAGTSVTFTATPTYGGSSPSYQWKVNNLNTGGNSSVYTYTPADNDVIRCILTSSNTVCVYNNPATSNTISMLVNPLLPVSVNITPSANPVCSGTSVTFTTAAVNGGSSAVYQWKVNGLSLGSNNPVYSYIPLNGDIVSCVLISNAVCATGSPATSNAVSMTVNPNLAVGIAITASANPFCSGNAVTITATPTNGGTAPTYQWKVNGANTGNNSSTYTYNPVNTDVITCTLTSNLPCTQSNPATSNTITMVVNNSIPAGISITANPNPFCPGTNVNYTATPINGGTLPSYQWKVNGADQGSNSSNYSYAPQPGDSIRCVITSNLSCVTNNPASSNKIVMNSLPLPQVSFPYCFDSITTINAAAFKLKGGVPIGGVYSGPGVNSFSGIFTPSFAGAGIKTITYSYTNVSSCSSAMTKNIIVQAAAVFSCGNNLSDIRDNKVYPTVQIGTQCWMQKNLDYGTSLQGTSEQTDNCINEKYCYSDNAANCTLYGGLYQWDELMAYSNTPGAQGLCPPGWHVPTQSEWNTLFTIYQNQALAGKPLQDSIFNGFRAKESGIVYSNISWKFQGFAILYWTSNPYGTIKALSHGVNLQNFSVSDYYSNRSNAFAVRCLKN